MFDFKNLTFRYVSAKKHRIEIQQAVLDGVMAERERLALSLHDGLGRTLTNAKLLLEGDERNRQAYDMISKAIEEMRGFARNLMSETLTRYGLKAAVQDICSDFANVEFYPFGEDLRYDHQLEQQVYLSVNELVNNAIRHSGATIIKLWLRLYTDRISFTVQDDGCGFDPDTVVEGMGFHNLRNRLQFYGGSINIDVAPDEGTQVDVEINITPKP
ncbi:MAG: histidine kinase [Tannerella sp.]|jgi:signal transduction histidine kinase|nr:histidine kinase [Tannerella sp.]